MKQSTLVQLVLLGSAATVYGAFSDIKVSLTQRSYASEADCRADWGTEDDCRQLQPDGRYYGPRYYWDSNRNRPVIVGRDGTERISPTARFSSESVAHGVARPAGFTRGGFGGFGHAFGRGG